MTKLPFLQFFTGDWLRDPSVRMLSPAARGIWFDLICSMAEGDRSGIIAGYKPALARLSGCSDDELAGALNELTMCRTCDITEDCNGIVTVTNRRMQREAKLRETESKRQAEWRLKHGRNAPVTPEITPSSRLILQSTEKHKSEEGSDKASKRFTEGGPGGNPAAKPLRGRQADVAALCEAVLNGQWVNDAGKWIERIRENPEKVWRCMSDVKCAASEGRIKTTAGQMAEYNWKVFE